MDLKPVFSKNDKRARWIIGVVSFILFISVVVLNKNVIKPDYPFSFNVHYFALANSIINSGVFVLLVIALWAVKRINGSITDARIICVIRIKK